MKYDKLIKKVTNLKGYAPKQSEFCKVLGITTSTMSARVQRNSNFSDNEIEQIEDYFGIDLTGDTDCVEIPYYDVKGSCGTGLMVCGEPTVSGVKFDNNMISKILRRKPSNLHIIEASGDSMESDIFEKDVLLIDISEINPMIPGIYVFTTQNNEYVFIKRLSLRPDGVLDVISTNPKYPPYQFTVGDMERLDFSVKGRVIKNLSRGL